MLNSLLSPPYQSAGFQNRGFVAATDSVMVQHSYGLVEMEKLDLCYVLGLLVISAVRTCLVPKQVLCISAVQHYRHL